MAGRRVGLSVGSGSSPPTIRRSGSESRRDRALPSRRRSLLASSWLLIGGLFPALPLEAQWAVERVELTARLDPPSAAVYGKARLILRNRSTTPARLLELLLPASTGAWSEPTRVWDRTGELAWHSEAPESLALPRRILVAPRSPLGPGKKIDVVVSYEMRLSDSSPGATLTDRSVRLDTTGWYPLPVLALPGSGENSVALPQALELTVHVPKEWVVNFPPQSKRIRIGTELATYEVRLKPVAPGARLFAAHEPRPSTSRQPETPLSSFRRNP